MDATITVRLTAGKSTYAMGELIPLELEFRGGESPRLVSEAAQVLAAHGSARAKGPLLEGLARWNEEWRGRAAELAFSSPARAPSTRQSSSRTSS